MKSKDHSNQELIQSLVQRVTELESWKAEAEENIQIHHNAAMLIHSNPPKAIEILHTTTAWANIATRTCAACVPITAKTGHQYAAQSITAYYQKTKPSVLGLYLVILKINSEKN